jgi:Zn-dependent protease
LGIPVRRITLFIFGGIAQIEGEPDEPSVEFKMAIAGPAMSVFLYIFLLLLARVFGFLGSTNVVIAALTYIAQVNLILAIFNLVPAFPLDGGRILRSVLWYLKGDYQSATRIAATMGNMFGILLIIIGIYWFLTGDIINGIWFAFIGWYIHRISRSYY